MNWGAGVLGFVGGAAGNYQMQKKKQREWNLEQASQQAELERKLHFEQVAGQYRTDEALRQQKLLQEQQMTPESIAYRDKINQEAIGLERDKAIASERGKYSVLGSEEVQGYMDQEYKRKLNEAVGLLKAQTDEKIRAMDAQTKDAINLINSNPDLTPEQKATMSWKTQAAAKGVKVPDTVKLTPENILKAQELAISRTKDVSEDEALDMLISLDQKKYGSTNPAMAKSILTDYYTAQQLTMMSPAKKKTQGMLGTQEGEAKGSTANAPLEKRVEAADQVLSKYESNPGMFQKKLDTLRMEDPEVWEIFVAANPNIPIEATEWGNLKARKKFDKTGVVGRKAKVQKDLLPF